MWRAHFLFGTARISHRTFNSLSKSSSVQFKPQWWKWSPRRKTWFWMVFSLDGSTPQCSLPTPTLVVPPITNPSTSALLHWGQVLRKRGLWYIPSRTSALLPGLLPIRMALPSLDTFSSCTWTTNCCVKVSFLLTRKETIVSTSKIWSQTPSTLLQFVGAMQSEMVTRSTSRFWPNHFLQLLQSKLEPNIADKFDFFAELSVMPKLVCWNFAGTMWPLVHPSLTSKRVNSIFQFLN